MDQSLFIPLLAAAFPALAQPDPPGRHRQPPVESHEHAGFIGERLWLERDHLLDTTWGARSALEERGVLIEATLIADMSKNLSGGAGHAGTFRHLFDLSVELDLDLLAGVEGGVVFLDFQTQEGQNGSAETGDVQAYSNIDADDFTALYEVWYQHTFPGGLARIKAGKIDVNADFAYVEHGGEFIHSSPGFSPTNFVLPTYPDPAFGVVAFVGTGGGLYAGAGLFDGALQEGVPTGTRGASTLFGDPADLFLIGETGYAWGGDTASLAGRLGVGAWHHTGGFARFGGGNKHHTTGFYAVFDQLLYKETADPEDQQGVGLFAQYGWADPEVSTIEHHIGVGVQWAGALPGRDDDVTGVMVSRAGLTEEPGAGFIDDAETAVEWFYKAQITPWLVLKPDVQFIANPGGTGLDDAWVGSLRLELVF